MNIQTIAQEQRVPSRNDGQRRAWLPWVGGILFALICVLGIFSGNRPAQAAVTQSTIPAEVPGEGETELLGPIDQISSTSEWIVAGIPVHLTAATRVDERVAPATVGAWARVEGQGDGIGGLNAARIKILLPYPTVKLEGLLTALTSSSAEVDAIAVALSTTTQIVGNPQPGIDRVEVRAIAQAGGGLLALRVQKEGPLNTPPVDPGEDAPNAQDGVQLFGLIGSLPTGGTVGKWIVSGVPVSVTAQTILVEQVGPLVKNAWVQVQGTVDANGELVARRIRTISQRRYHRVKGLLQELTETSLLVGGLSLQRDALTALEGNPTVGQRVEVDANLLADGSLLAVKIEADEGEHENTERHTVEFVGRVESLPAGTLYGEWLVDGRRVLVISGVTQIDEHKGLIEINALVKVEGTRNGDGSINALEIAVKRGEEDDNKPGEDHAYTKFVGLIEALPANGLLGEWTVNGQTVVVNERTELDGDATFVISDTVKVEGYAQADGSVLAREIEKENEDNDQEVKFTGAIESLPQDGLLGEWTVDGKQVLVNAQTELKNAAYAVGDSVDVEGHRQQDGLVVAKKIEKRGDNTGGGGQEVTFSGDIETLPQNGLLGEWTVDGKRVLVNPQTELKESVYTVGDTVKVEGRQQQDGVVVAKKIEK